jgi:hypothetical protein
MAFLGSLMSKAFMILGWKSSIFGYISIGEIVPEVNITFLYFEKRGLVAKEASRQ